MERRLRLKLVGGEFRDVPSERSNRMRAVRGRGNKSTERRFRGMLVRAGLRGWTMNPKGICGNPDFYFRVARLAVFLDGCFWHGCPRCGHTPKANRPFWREKLRRNRERDDRNTAELIGEGTAVLRFWEHELHDGTDIICLVVESLRRASSSPSAGTTGRHCRGKPEVGRRFRDRT